MITGNTLLVLLNAHDAAVPFTLPTLEGERQWLRVVDTAEAHLSARTFPPGSQYPLGGRTVTVFQMTPPCADRRKRACDIADLAELGADRR
jgi:hypothetical protein